MGEETQDGPVAEAASQRRLIVGLGNPGREYERTRHNLGFRVVEALAARWGMSLDETLCNSRFARSSGVDLALPQTFMNRSGFAVRCLKEHFEYVPSSVLVVYDEVAFPLGRLRLRAKGSPGGHRGMESVIESLRTDEVPRLRVGVAPEDGEIDDLVRFVLEDFTATEEELVEAVIERAADACDSWLKEGVTATMNQFN
ncbi:MAG: aminoacyl-tRNA hydrolase [Acidobacteriota bacterium]